jgi:hypothetical protein
LAAEALRSWPKVLLDLQRDPGIPPVLGWHPKFYRVPIALAVPSLSSSWLAKGYNNSSCLQLVSSFYLLLCAVGDKTSLVLFTLSYVRGLEQMMKGIGDSLARIGAERKETGKWERQHPLIHWIWFHIRTITFRLNIEGVSKVLTFLFFLPRQYQKLEKSRFLRRGMVTTWHCSPQLEGQLASQQ